MNKDWSGRPLYAEAYAAAYFGTRQWVQAVRSWVNDEAFWRRVQEYSNRYGGALDHEIRGAVGMSFFSGHWDGQGEPTGDLGGPGSDLIGLRQATNSYFEDRSKTVFRQKWEGLIKDVADPNPQGALGFVPSSQPMQQTHQFIRLQVTELKEIDSPDLLPYDDADYFALIEIAGQPFRSALINGRESFSFPRPHAPFTFMKALPRTQRFDEALCNMQIEVTTSDDWWSGTDDNVYLRINNSTRFNLDKPLYNDFERGDRDTYSIPLDGRRLTIGDIEFLQIEKSPDGAAGGWKLQGIKVWANGRLIYQNNSINKWLEDNKRTWRATNFTPRNPDTREVPIHMALYDYDTVTANDHCDLHGDHDRYDVALLYDPARGEFRGDYSGVTNGTAQGGDRYGGRLSDDDDRARVKFRLETLIPQPATAKVNPVLAPFIVGIKAARF
jgi:hypothetical protein